MRKEKILIIVFVAIIVLFIGGLLVLRLADDSSVGGSSSQVTGQGTENANVGQGGTAQSGISGSTEVVEEIINGELKAISFSQEGIVVTKLRFFSEDVKLKIEVPQGAKVYYTINGKEPNGSSTEYTGPITLQAAEGNFPNCIVLKARAYYADGSKSEVVTHSFFAQKQMETRFETIVFSITGDPKDLTNQNTGILYGDNAKQRGTESEREVYIEAINSDGSLIFEQGAGIRPYGGASRGSAVKSMKLFARKEYDPNHGKFEIDAFGTIGADGKVMNKYDKLVLRNYGNDFQFAFIRDELNHRLAAEAGSVECEAVVPAVVYLNGKYYGLFYLHESYCDDFFKDKYGGVSGHYEVIEGNEQYKNEDDDDEENVKAAKEFNFMYNYLAYSDLREERYYEELRAFMDVENYLQYYAYNIYINNNDWPQNNYKCYRYYAGEAEEYGEGETDGRWRFLLHDMDYSMGLYNSDDTVANYNNLKHILTPKDKRYSPLFANLMQREDCRRYFLEELEKLMNDSLSVEKVENMLNSMLTERENEMVFFFEHLEKLKETDDSIWIWYEEYLERTDNIRKFTKERKKYMEKFLEEQFG